MAGGVTDPRALPRDGALATETPIGRARGLAVLPDGGYLVTDSQDNTVLRVSATGRVDLLAAGAGFDGPAGVLPRADGSVLVADANNNCIRRIDRPGVIFPAAGACAPGTAGGSFSGDGGPAPAARLDLPLGIDAQAGGGYLIADNQNNRVRRVSAGGSIATVAGRGPEKQDGGFAGDGGPATAAALSGPADVADLPGGGLLIADSENDRVRRVDASGRISTVAGARRNADQRSVPVRRGTRARGALLAGPSAVAPLRGGGFVFAEADVVRRVTPRGRIEAVAGRAGTSLVPFGDGGSPRRARLDGPDDVEPLPDGGYLIATAGRVRYVAPSRPRLLAVALTGGRPRLRPGRRSRLRLSLTRAASVRVELRRSGSRRIRRVRGRRLRAGRRSLSLPALRRGRWIVRVVAREGQAAASDRLTAVVR